jgi:hypothetical protein
MSTIFDEMLCGGFGQYDSRIKSQIDYEAVTVLDALTCHPKKMAKSHSPWIIPSTHRKSDARTHEVQRHRGRYCLLTADIDSGNHSLDEIDAAITLGVNQDVARRIYSTASSKDANKKWRVLIPVLKSLDFGTWNRLQAALNLHLENCGIHPDRVLERAAQLVYLPNIKTSGFYQNALNGNYEFGYPEHEGCQLHVLSEQIKIQKQKDVILHKESQTVTSKKTDGTSAIDAFNAKYSIEQLLNEYGYIRSGNSDSWRSPYQQSESYATKDFGDHWVSLSGSDAGSGLGVVNLHGGCSGDAFALYAHYEYKGDFIKAIKELME